MFAKDPTLLAAGFASLEALLNSALRYDPASQQRLAKLGEKTLQIRCTAPQLDAYLCLQGGQIRVQQICEQPVDCQLSGSLAALSRLGLGEQHSLADSGVELRGSTGLLIELQAIAKELDIDWEEPLSQLLGDIAGPSLAQMIRGAASCLRDSHNNFSQRSGELLSEELQATPHPQELNHFSEAVNQVRNDSERLAAKLQRLQKSISSIEEHSQENTKPQTPGNPTQ